MSFILDALRKSESERQQDARPSITRIPDAVPQRAVPTWALGTIGILALGVFVLAAAWWRTGAAPPSGADRGSAASVIVDVTPAAPLPRLEPASRDAPAEAGTASRRTGLRDAAAGAAAPLRDAAAGAAAPTRDRPVIERAAPAPVSIDPLPASYASMASQLGLPPLRLELHVYNRDDPASRFVFINGKRYGEGDTLSEGPRVIAIDGQGVVLLAGGSQLQLTPD